MTTPSTGMRVAVLTAAAKLADGHQPRARGRGLHIGTVQGRADPNDGVSRPPLGEPKRDAPAAERVDVREVKGRVLGVRVQEFSGTQFVYPGQRVVRHRQRGQRRGQVY